MEFYTASTEKRPVRLCEETRRFAWESLHGRYGDEAMRTPCVTLDDIEGFTELTPLEKYDAAILRIAAQAPLRLCKGEQVAGAAE